MTELVEVSDADVAAVDVPRLLRARKLFGWPVHTLDDLVDLRRRANAFDITVDEWREQSQALRTADLPVPDPSQLAATRKAASLVMLEELRGGDYDGPVSRLVRRLEELDAPPTDEALWVEAGLCRTRAESAADRHRADWAGRAQDVAQMVTRNWSTHDPVSGLPWALLGRYRWVHFGAAGLVPAPLGLARELAECDVDAGVVGGDAAREQRRVVTGRTARERASMAGASSRMQLHFLTGLLAELRTHGAPRGAGGAALVERVEQVWASKAMDRFLLERTAAGWPRKYVRARRTSAAGAPRAE